MKAHRHAILLWGSVLLGCLAAFGWSQGWPFAGGLLGAALWTAYSAGRRWATDVYYDPPGYAGGLRLSRGSAVVPPGMDPATVGRLNGGPTDVTVAGHPGAGCRACQHKVPHDHVSPEADGPPDATWHHPGLTTGDTIDGCCGFCGLQGHRSRHCLALGPQPGQVGEVLCEDDVWRIAGCITQHGHDESWPVWEFPDGTRRRCDASEAREVDW